MAIYPLTESRTEEFKCYLEKNNIQLFQIGPKISRRLCYEAVVNPHVILYVSEADGRLVGFILVVINKKQFLQKLLLADPLLALAVTKTQIRRILKRILPQVKSSRASLAQAKIPITVPPTIPIPIQENIDLKGSWEEENNEIAKLILVYVSPEYRGSGTGVSLCQRAINELKIRKVRRLDLLVNKHNTKSLKMFQKIKGINFIARGDNFFGMIHIGDTDWHD